MHERILIVRKSQIMQIDKKRNGMIHIYSSHEKFINY